MDDDRYRLCILTRCRVAGLRLKPGSILTVSPTKLRVAAHLTRCGTARPADEHTRLDIAVFEALRDAKP